jgi:hypothetical protein
VKRAALVVLVLSLAAHAQSPALAGASSPQPGSSAVLTSVLIGASGLALAGGYLAGAFLTGDRPSGFALGLTGGLVSGGLFGAGVGLAINHGRSDPGSVVGYILRPVLGGLAGALVGGLLAGLASNQPGPARTVTHGVVIGFVVTETVLVALFR